MNRRTTLTLTSLYSMRPTLIRDGMRLLSFASAGLSLVALVAVSSTARAQAPDVLAPSGLDCNGLSPLEQPAAPLRFVCADVAPQTGEDHTEDNDTYIGHDEPLVTFYSGVVGSANNVQWEFTLARERPLPATQSFQNFITF